MRKVTFPIHCIVCLDVCRHFLSSIWNLKMITKHFQRFLFNSSQSNIVSFIFSVHNVFVFVTTADFIIFIVPQKGFWTESKCKKTISVFLKLKNKTTQSNGSKKYKTFKPFVRKIKQYATKYWKNFGSNSTTMSFTSTTNWLFDERKE